MDEGILVGDCLEVMRSFEAESVDLLATDPPYGISFMGKDWDRAVPSVDVWRECFRVLKAGSFAFVMSLPRLDVLSQMAVRLQEAGFRVDLTPLFWAFASGFPKATNISKAVDKRLGEAREIVGKSKRHGGVYLGQMNDDSWKPEEFPPETTPSSPEAKALDGSYAGFQPKPALELILRAQKPLNAHARLTIITSQTMLLICKLESCSDVGSAAPNTKGQKDMEATVRGLAIAQSIEGALVQLGKVADIYGLMAMSRSTLERLRQDTLATNWSIASLWKSILVVLLERASRFTTSTATEAITELRTLNFYLSQSIPDDTTQGEGFPQSGSRLNVGVVDELFKSVLTKSLSPSPASVPESASSQTVAEGQPTSASDAEENIEPSTPSENTVPKNATGRISVGVVLVAMKPLSEKTYVEQALKNGKGVTWLDEARIPFQNDQDRDYIDGRTFVNSGDKFGGYDSAGKDIPALTSDKGRFPANLICSDDALNDGVHGDTIGHVPSIRKRVDGQLYGFLKEQHLEAQTFADIGTFSRYFSLDAWWAEKVKELPESVRKTFPFLIEPKASKEERNEGLEGFKVQIADAYAQHRGRRMDDKSRIDGKPPATGRNNHPTVKPLAIMSYLITLGSRRGDTVLDPFVGSGTTCMAAKMLGRRGIGIEINPEYVKIAEARLKSVSTIEAFIESKPVVEAEDAPVEGGRE